MSSTVSSGGDSGHPSGQFEGEEKYVDDSVLEEEEEEEFSKPRHLRVSKTISNSASGASGSSSNATTPASVTINGPTTTTATVNNSSLRKYLVLLQDCLAIKFIGINDNCRQPRNHPTSCSCGPKRVTNSILCGGGDGEETNNDDDGKTPYDDNNDISSGRRSAVNNFCGPHNHAINRTPATNTPEEQKGLSLFKAFREANLQCHWNATLCEAIRGLEYKGYLVPSTILAFSSKSRFRSVIRTAWARKMLRCPAKYSIGFVGEIEEIITESVSQSQFAPLSDSLCWAILELTSSGHEAFVDSILLALCSAFPLMSLPPKELVYQTLERLIRDRKIYQTAQGYFIVTPDTFRYMNAGGPGHNTYAFSNDNGCLLDALTSSYDADKMSQHSYSLDTLGSSSKDELLAALLKETRYTPLKRHNSLKVLRQRDVKDEDMNRSLRLCKTRSLIAPSPNDDGDGFSTPYVVPSATEAKGHQKNVTPEENAKKPSFFRRLFSLKRPPKPPTNKKGKMPNVAAGDRQRFQEGGNNSNTKPETALPILQRSPKIYAQLPHSKAAECRSYENILMDEKVGKKLTMPLKKCDSLPSRNNRRSLASESPFYEVPNFVGARARSRTPLHLNPLSNEEIKSTPDPQSFNGQKVVLRKISTSTMPKPQRPRSIAMIDCPELNPTFHNNDTTVRTTARNKIYHHPSNNYCNPWRPRSAFIPTTSRYPQTLSNYYYNRPSQYHHQNHIINSSYSSVNKPFKIPCHPLPQPPTTPAPSNNDVNNGASMSKRMCKSFESLRVMRARSRQ